jgi:gamma-glutamyltranspeptidase/glutathione hydrolase
VPEWSRQQVSRTTVETAGPLAVGFRRQTVDAGLEVMAEGGTAVDAAVAMCLVATVLEPSETSIGGSGFLLLDDPALGDPVSVEFPPVAPRAAEPGLAPSTRPGCSGPLMPCVPGIPRGLALAHARFGSLRWERLLEPAIALAEDGFEVDEYLCLQLLAHLEEVRADPGCAAVYLRNGLPPVPQFAWRDAERPPPLLRQPALAATLRAIARDGGDALYVGAIGEAIAAAFAEHGGILDADDLAARRVAAGAPRTGEYRGWRIATPGGPCGGPAVLDALRGMEERGAGVAATAAALREAFERRYRFAGEGEGAGHGTTHVCAVDREGRLVSCTITIGETFGSRFLVPETGVLFDSGLAWFDPGDGPNAIAGGRRPLVNMSPLLLRAPDGRRIALGAPGARRIISALTQVVSGIVDRGLTVQEAIEAPRLDASEGTLLVSDRMPADLRAALGDETLPIREEHAPFTYDLARPAGIEVLPDGSRRGGVTALNTGYVGAL